MGSHFSRLSDLLLLVARLPWPVGVLVALLSFSGLHALTSFLPLRWTILGLALQFAVPTSALLWSALSFWHRSHGATIAGTVEYGGTSSADRMSWPEFEMLIAETFRRRGFVVTHNAASNPFGGFDLILKKQESICLVQCKHWRTRCVGVKLLRNLYGLMRQQRADSGCIVTAGTFTDEARQYGADMRIDLIDGRSLLEIILDSDAPVSGDAGGAPGCPQCGEAMVRRTARRETGEATDFWGCSHFPDCRGTRVDWTGERRRAG